MNYYIQGDPQKSEQIKAAFESKGYTTNGWNYNSKCGVYFTNEVDKTVDFTHIETFVNLIKTHPDYKELELPIEFKDGDIIGFNDYTHNSDNYVDWIGIYKQRASGSRQHLFHCVITSERRFRVGGSWRIFTAYPATQEQRELLFAKMKEAGYQWDADKKELRKIFNPKFQVGKWIAYNENKTSLPPRQIKGITGNRYIVSENGAYDFKTLEADWHLWTIADAKKGDILIDEASNTIGIFKKIYGFHWDSEIYCGNSPCGAVFHSGGFHKIEDAKPATREQRDLLFKKIKEAGYTWDADKKELRKIKPHYDIANFKPFDKVLVRVDNKDMWTASLYSNYDKTIENHFVTIESCYSQCIPFNDDTKHLLGTTDMCDEQYVNWTMTTRINITIQDGKVTWIEQMGDELPMWDELVASVTNVVERS